MSLPTRYVLAAVVFPKLSKLLYQEDAWAHPVYMVISALRRYALAGRRNAAERRDPSFDVTL
jgi:hypothetical protein